MNAAAMKKLEIMNEIAFLPEDDLDKVQSLIKSMLAARPIPRNRRSLAGIWMGKGFEKISDLKSELAEARQELNEVILHRSI